MRPPYGEYNDLVSQVVASRGQIITLWDFDSGDSSGVPTAQRLQAYTDRAAAHPPTVLTLNHEFYGSFSNISDALECMISMDFTETTAHQVVPHAISVLQAAGYRLVTVAECLGVEPYQSVTTPQAVRGSPLHVDRDPNSLLQGTWSC